jgi:hypothetical protein
LKLPIADRTKLAHWILETVVEEVEPPKKDAVEVTAESTPESNSVWPPKNLRIADSEKISGKKSWHAEIPRAKDLTEEERQEVAKQLFGAWKETTPDDFAEQIMSARTISEREINLDE